MKLTVFFSIIFLLLITFFKPAVKFVSGYLTLNQKVSANLLIVEGWVNSDALRFAHEEFMEGEYDYIVTTGLDFQNQYTMYFNSYLIFFPRESLKSDTIFRKHVFEIHAASSLEKKDSCHFIFWINNTSAGGFYTSNNKGKIQITWEGRISELDSVMIQFDSDKDDHEGDRNLIIKKFNLNQKNLMVEHATMFLDRGNPFGEYRRNVTATSYAEQAGNYFTDRGIEPGKVIPVSNNYLNKMRTYGNALALKEWMQDFAHETPGVNIVSMNYHSRRTWLIYKKLIGHEINTGIISVPSSRIDRSRRARYTSMFKESVAMIYYYVFILPWV